MTSAKQPDPKSPDQCETMIDVRAGVDQVDRELDRSARHPIRVYATPLPGSSPNAAWCATRRARRRCIAQAKREAAAAGLVPDRLRAVWNELVEQSIAHEAAEWDNLRADH